MKTDLLWRPLRSADRGDIVELAAACLVSDGGLPSVTDEAFVQERFLPAAPGVALGAFDTVGTLLAATAIQPDPRTKKPRGLIAGMVHPDHRRQGIGARLLRWSVDQGRSLLMKLAPDDPPRLVIATEGLTADAARLYQRFGFTQEFAEDVMRRDLRQRLAEAPLPPGITLMPWTPELTESFFAAYSASFQDRPGFPGWSLDLWRDWAIADDGFYPEASFLARHGDLPTGFIICDTGWVTQMGVIPAYRGRGLGAALLTKSLRCLRDAGQEEALLDVNVNNPVAARLYTRLGFEPVGRRARWILQIN